MRLESEYVVNNKGFSASRELHIKETGELLNARKPMRDEKSEAEKAKAKLGDLNDPSTWELI